MKLQSIIKGLPTNNNTIEFTFLYNDLFKETIGIIINNNKWYYLDYFKSITEMPRQKILKKINSKLKNKLFHNQTKIKKRYKLLNYTYKNNEIK
jgi:hypothetical protein